MGTTFFPAAYWTICLFSNCGFRRRDGSCAPAVVGWSLRAVARFAQRPDLEQVALLEQIRMAETAKATPEAGSHGWFRRMLVFALRLVR